MKFKIGDKVIVPDRNNATGIMADLIGDLEDGLVSHRTKALADEAMLDGKPVEIHSIEEVFPGEMGYILSIKGKPFSGVLSEDQLELYTPKN